MRLSGPYVVVAINAVPLEGAQLPEIEFADEGRVHGHVVNRFSGTCEQSDGLVAFGAIAATRMAGPPELMAREDSVFAVLNGAVTVSGPDDGPVLLTSDGGSLTLARPATEPSIEDPASGFEQL